MCNSCRAVLLSLVISLAGVSQVLAQNPNCRGIWISNEELAAIPTSGRAWESLKSTADGSAGSPTVSNQDDAVNVRVLAKALVYARTGVESYRTDVINACMAAIGTETGGRTLALGRELIAYVIAADLVGLPADKDTTFKTWLRKTLTETLDGKTLISTHEERPNNWGTHAGGSRAAVAFYLGDWAELDRAAKVFRGWLGDRASYSGFTYGDTSWQSDPSRPVGINPRGATISGHSVDGVLPDDQRRAGGFVWPPPKENYVYEALQGALAQAVIFERAGYPMWTVQDNALLRAYEWLHAVCGFPATGDDTWEPHLINYYYGKSYSAPSPTTCGKNVGWTDYTHILPSPIKTGLHGRIDNAAKSPVSGAEVTLQGGGKTYTARSNSFGCYRFVNVPAGSYELQCSASGLKAYTGSVTLSSGGQVFGKNVVLGAGTGDTVPPSPPTNLREVNTVAQ